MRYSRLFPCVLVMTACAGGGQDQHAIMSAYADLAYATFSDSYQTALELQKSIDAFLDSPDAAGHDAAKRAWLQARNPYGQSEVFRFGNPNVDAWEGEVNAWPVDEGLIDYVSPGYEYAEGNPFAMANIIAGNESITPELLRDYHEKAGAEANVATGYHAIEFLLWGQDLNQQPAHSGLRPYTDYVLGAQCSNSHCERRRTYLKVVTDLLVQDLKHMMEDWAPGNNANYRAAFLRAEPVDALRRMLFGMGGLSLGELAGERMNVALLAGAQEDEQSCFSDNTHMDIAANLNGIRNVYLGEYRRVDDTLVRGTSLSDLVRQQSLQTDTQLREQLDMAAAKVTAIVQAAQQGEAFDQQILMQNQAGRQRIKAAIKALHVQTAGIEAAANALGIPDLNAAEPSE